MPMRPRRLLRSSSSWMSFSAAGCWCRSRHGARKTRTVQLAADLVHELLGDGQQGQRICFRDRGLARETLASDCAVRLDASARRLFNQASYVCPAESLLRLRRARMS